MRVNADFERIATVAPEQYRWIASPQPGVERVMLDRVGEEQARATSIVRYAPASRFPRHQHPGGEEIFVLSGTFSDEQGNYPAGHYLRNPPGSGHAPSSGEGTTLFVKLRQMPPGEKRQVRVDTRDPTAWQRRDGREVCLLFSDGTEQVCLQRVRAGEALFSSPVNGAELLVLSGELRLDDQPFAESGWIRLPGGASPRVVAGAPGATFYFKTGHLDGAPDAAARGAATPP